MAGRDLGPNRSAADDLPDPPTFEYSLGVDTPRALSRHLREAFRVAKTAVADPTQAVNVAIGFHRPATPQEVLSLLAGVGSPSEVALTGIYDPGGADMGGTMTSPVPITLSGAIEDLYDVQTQVADEDIAELGSVDDIDADEVADTQAEVDELQAFRTRLVERGPFVKLTDNHAGEARMSPLAAVALAREQGVRTVVHTSCRDRNRLALQSQVVGAAALGSEGVLCVQGDPVDDVPRVGDLTATRLIRRVKDWAAPQPIAVGAVVNPFADDVGREIALLERKLAAGAEFVQSQMTFDVTALITFLDRAAGLLHEVRFYAGLGLLRNERMADRASELPGCVLPDAAHRRIVLGDGLPLAKELARELAGIAAVDALHIYPLGAESATRDIAAAFRTARGAPAYRD